MTEIKSLKTFITDGLKDEITDFTVNNKCSGCGGCCTNFLPLSKKEIESLRDYIHKNNVNESRVLIPLATKTLDFTCPFRDNKNKTCKVYAVRPEVCRLFTCNNSTRSKKNRDKLSKCNKIIDMRSEFYANK